MKIKIFTLFVLNILLVCSYCFSQNSISVTNINWIESNGKIVISYDLPINAHNISISATFLNKNNPNFKVEVKNAIGSIGIGVFSGLNQSITWDYKADGCSNLPKGNYYFKIFIFDASVENSFTDNSRHADKPEMINVEGGTFQMGSNDGSSGDKPVHSVTVSRFKICTHLITVGEYKIFCIATERPMPEAPSWGWNDRHPMIYISWNDADAYCDWLSNELKGNYRLPTEAEWEYAARGGNKSKGFTYAGSNDLNEVGWYKDNSVATNPVMKKKPNELGLYDMSGNVWEWCSDWLGEYSSKAQTNPKGPLKGYERVMRGGCFKRRASFCRSTNRSQPAPVNGDNNFGFRVVSIGDTNQNIIYENKKDTKDFLYLKSVEDANSIQNIQLPDYDIKAKSFLENSWGVTFNTHFITSAIPIIESRHVYDTTLIYKTNSSNTSNGWGIGGGLGIDIWPFRGPYFGLGGFVNIAFLIGSDNCTIYDFGGTLLLGLKHIKSVFEYRSQSRSISGDNMDLNSYDYYVATTYNVNRLGVGLMYDFSVPKEECNISAMLLFDRPNFLPTTNSSIMVARIELNAYVNFKIEYSQNYAIAGERKYAWSSNTPDNQDYWFISIGKKWNIASGKYKKSKTIQK
ncbi:MAG: formylglycine-generating enzyme family protein [Bacteroidota bacterium]